MAHVYSYMLLVPDAKWPFKPQSGSIYRGKDNIHASASVADSGMKSICTDEQKKRKRTSPSPELLNSSTTHSSNHSRGDIASYQLPGALHLRLLFRTEKVG